MPEAASSLRADQTNRFQLDSGGEDSVVDGDVGDDYDVDGDGDGSRDDCDDDGDHL